MHELSIAYNLVEIAGEAAREAGATHIDVVHLRVGALSGVVKEALLFGYEIATADTILAGSRLEIEEVPVVVYCPTCDAEHALPDLQEFACPVCGTPTSNIVQGKELQLVSLEYED
ncbi:MAG: hydrogenase maturation nickel metallochaperone HypA [Caldilineae bacterium]|nr:MAG: hydrogenase maturation nickel metallochaperone HypA [Caldilineae bacterium]